MVFRKILFFLLMMMTGGSLSAQENLGLKDVYKDYFKVGCAINMGNFYHPEDLELILREYNSITAENDHKTGMVHPREGVWNWQGADVIANFCRENHLPLRLHNLCWHAQFADWMMYDEQGNPVPDEVFYARLRDHIFTIVDRYRDIIYAIDVVNEAMADGGPDVQPYRPSKLYERFGDEFIAKAFQFAAEAAGPDVLLIYNDYNAADRFKSQRIFNMVKKMKEEYGVRVDGIGMQGHYNIYGPSAAEVDSAITMYRRIVDHIQFTELDVRVNMEMGGQLQFSQKGEEITDEVKARHSEQYRALFEVFRKHRDVIDCVTFWNVSDRDSWLTSSNYPLLFDKALQRKDAYRAITSF